MTMIDRYVLRQFIVTALFALLVFTIVFVVIDMMENLDDFLDKSASIGVIAAYYLYFTPEIIKLMVPVAMLLSALFTTGRMSSYNEMTALKASGVSLYRFMLPLIAFSMLVSGVAIYFNGWVVPFANHRKLQIARVYFQKNIEFISRNNIFIQDSRTRILAIGMFDEQRGIARQVSIQDFDPEDPTIVVERFDAREMLYDPTTATWSLVQGTHRILTHGTETMTSFQMLPIGKLNFSPEDIRKKQEKPEEMDYTDLKTFIENQQRSGQDVARWLVDFYGKIAFPFASVIVVLFGVPFSSIKRRSGPGIEFGIAVGVCFLYMIFLQASQAFGYNGDLHPLLTAWLANLIFLVAGIVILIRAPK
jgi:lipopolysaccharide export system permease protein